MALREVEEGIAAVIREDPAILAAGNISVVVEDKACLAYEIAKALGELGVCITVSVTGFDKRADLGPMVQGTLHFEIACYEHPTLNRTDASTPTAQWAAEHLARILNWRRIPQLTNKLIFRDFSRDDVEEANIVRGRFEAEHRLGFEENANHQTAGSKG